MAKQTETKDNALKKQETSEEIKVKFDEAVELAKEDLKSTLTVNDKVISDIKNQYGKAKIAGIKDLASYEVVQDGIKYLKSLRIGIDNHRKELTKPALEFQKTLIAFADSYIDEIKPIEQHLKTEKENFEDLVEAEKKRVFIERKDLLIENGYELVRDMFVCGVLNIEAETLGSMDEDKFKVYLQKGKEEIERKKAEEKLQKEKEERMNKKMSDMQAELEKLRKEKEEFKAQAEALEKTYGKIEADKSEGKKDPEPTKKPSEPDKKQPEPNKNETKNQIDAKKTAKGYDWKSVEPEENVKQMSRGFEYFRQRMLKFLKEEPKLGRQMLIDFVEKQEM